MEVSRTKKYSERFPALREIFNQYAPGQLNGLLKTSNYFHVSYVAAAPCTPPPRPTDDARLPHNSATIGMMAGRTGG